MGIFFREELHSPLSFQMTAPPFPDLYLLLTIPAGGSAAQFPFTSDLEFSSASDFSSAQRECSGDHVRVTFPFFPGTPSPPLPLKVSIPRLVFSLPHHPPFFPLSSCSSGLVPADKAQSAPLPGTRVRSISHCLCMFSSVFVFCVLAF